MESNFKEDLLKFNSEHAKLFYLIYYFSKFEDLNTKQKTKLKSLIISEDKKIFDLLEQFEKTDNEKQLLKEFINICTIVYNENQNETPKKKKRDDFSLSQKLKRKYFKYSCESSSKIFESKFSVSTENSFLNRTTVPFDSKIKTKFGKLSNYEFPSASRKHPKNFTHFNTNNKIKNMNLKSIQKRDQENLNIIVINNTALYQYSPLNRAYQTISRQSKV